MNLSTTDLVIIAVVVVAVIVALLLAWRRHRSTELKSRFGPEYQRTVEEAGGRRQAEAELARRQKRVSHFHIEPLSPADKTRFVATWMAIQAEFVDEPKTALMKADDLVTEVMRTRGYPVETFEQQSADLSVDHPSVVQNYRAGRDIALRHKRGQADTEDLRRAMIHYRKLFDELVDEVDEAAQTRAS